MKYVVIGILIAVMILLAVSVPTVIEGVGQDKPDASDVAWDELLKSGDATAGDKMATSVVVAGRDVEMEKMYRDAERVLGSTEGTAAGICAKIQYISGPYVSVDSVALAIGDHFIEMGGIKNKKTRWWIFKNRKALKAWLYSVGLHEEIPSFLAEKISLKYRFIGEHHAYPEGGRIYCEYDWERAYSTTLYFLDKQNMTVFVAIFTGENSETSADNFMALFDLSGGER